MLVSVLDTLHRERRTPGSTLRQRRARRGAPRRVGLACICPRLASAAVAKIFEGTFTPEESRLYEAIFVRLAADLQASQNVLAEAMDKTAPGSPNHRARSNQVWDAYEQVGLLLYSAEDHLRAMLMLLEGPHIPTYSLYTLLRAAAEAVVRCAYLLDLSLTEPQRLARGLNVRLENLLEQNKVVPDEKLFAERVTHLEERAAANGIEVFKKRQDRPATDFGERRMSEVALFSEYIRGAEDPDVTTPLGETLFRYLSGHVHSMVWVKLSQANATATDEPGMSSVKLDMKFDWLAAMMAMVLRVHERNIASLLRLSGYPQMVWDEAKKTATVDAHKRLARLAEPRRVEEKGEPT
jgi:hypothetical protein